MSVFGEPLFWIALGLAVWIACSPGTATRTGLGALWGILIERRLKK